MILATNPRPPAEHAAAELIARTSVLTRLLAKEVTGRGLSRTEAGLLRSLIDGPRRITELAEHEGLAQPTTTLLVKRLDGKGLVRRERQRDDERVVLVWLTDAGGAALEGFRAHVRAALRTHLDAISDEQLNALAEATEVVEQLITLLLKSASEPGANG